MAICDSMGRDTMGALFSTLGEAVDAPFVGDSVGGINGKYDGDCDGVGVLEGIMGGT